MQCDASLCLSQIVAMLAVLVTLSGCAPEFTIDNCQVDEDCFSAEVCLLGECQLAAVSNDMRPEEDMGGDVAPDMPGEDMAADLPVVDVDTVRVLPLETTLDLLETQQLTATVLDAEGNELAGREVEWTSSLDAVASVDDSGLVTALAEGSATIRATVDGVEGSATISVIKAPVANITLMPTSSTLGIGGTVELIARVEDAAGGELFGRDIQWSSTDMSIATVDANGMVTALALGETEIIAITEGVEGRADIEVVPEPVSYVTITPPNAQVEVTATLQLDAQTFDANDNELTGRTVNWVSSDNSFATVDNTGLVTGVAAGSVLITATSEGQSEMAMISVVARPVDSVDVVPSMTTLNPSDTLQYSAIPRAADGSALTGRAVTWTSGNASVATVDVMGLVTAQAVGTTMITADVEGVTGSGTLDVVEAIASVDVTPTSGAGDIGGTVSYTATPRDQAGNALVGRTCTFTSQDTAVATVDMNTGVATIVGEGDATITATCEGVSGIATVAGLGPVTSVTVMPASAMIPFSSTQQFTVELRDSSNHVLTGRTVTWASSDMTIATIDSSGLATASANAGTTTITATSESVDGTASLTVGP